MSTPSAKILIELLKNNHSIMHQQVKDVTQVESMVQPPFRGNCLNWDIGHLLDVYGEMLEEMGLPGTMSEAEKKTYGYGSEPLCDAAKAGDLNAMLARLDKALPVIVEKLDSLSAEELERKVKIWRGEVSLIEALFFMQWHASFHTGQLELLRQLSGKNDKVI